MQQDWPTSGFIWCCVGIRKKTPLTLLSFRGWWGGHCLVRLDPLRKALCDFRQQALKSRESWQGRCMNVDCEHNKSFTRSFELLPHVVSDCDRLNQLRRFLRICEPEQKWLSAKTVAFTNFKVSISTLGRLNATVIVWGDFAVRAQSGAFVFYSTQISPISPTYTNPFRLTLFGSFIVSQAVSIS